MNALTGILPLLREALHETARSTARSGAAFAALVGATPVILLASALAAPLGIVGGFLVSLLHAALVGWYLALIGVAQTQPRKLTLGDLRGLFGRYLWEVMSVRFVFWIASLLLDQTPVWWIAVAISAVVFNPVPEIIYQRDTRALALLQDAARFVQENWPEWFGVHLVAGALFAVPLALLLGPEAAVAQIVTVLQLFGPWFGFITAGVQVLGLAGSGAMSALGAVLTLVFVHAWMIFRGHLFRKLSRSSRRSRAWKARLK